MAGIELRRVNKRFAGGTVAVRGADITIGDGELFVLVGPSGCGKSTLLNMIAGLETVSSGEIYIDGRPVNDTDPKDRNIAMVFQSYALYPHMTVRDNIGFPLRMAGIDRREIERRVSQAAASLELEELLDRKPHSLSGGQRQRVAMGRAIVREPAAFLLDEPLSNLDARLRIQTRAEIARLQKRLGATMIYVTHDQIEAMTLGDRLAVLDRGEVQQIGTPRELYEAPCNRFVAGFLGAPTMNFLAAELRDGRLTLPMCECRAPDSIHARYDQTTRQVVAGIRPEDLHHGRGNEGKPWFTAVIDMLEWTGADLHAYLRIDTGTADGAFRAAADAAKWDLTGDTTIVARLDGAVRIVEGEPVDLHLDPEKLHLFDAGSGRNLLA